MGIVIDADHDIESDRPDGVTVTPGCRSAPMAWLATPRRRSYPPIRATGSKRLKQRSEASRSSTGNEGDRWRGRFSARVVTGSRATSTARRGGAGGPRCGGRHVDHPGSARARRGSRARRRRDLAEPLPHVGGADHVDEPGLVLEVEEHHSLRRARLLTVGDHPGDVDDRAIGSSRSVSAVTTLVP